MPRSVKDILSHYNDVIRKKPKLTVRDLLIDQVANIYIALKRSQKTTYRQSLPIPSAKITKHHCYILMIKIFRKNSVGYGCLLFCANVVGLGKKNPKKDKQVRTDLAKKICNDDWSYVVHMAQKKNPALSP